MPTPERNVYTEHIRDLQHAAGLIAALAPEDRETIAYQHASHGCDFEDSPVVCPVCSDDSGPFDEPLAYGIGRDVT